MYLPLTRLVSLHVEQSERLYEAYRAFLAAEAARVRKHETEHRYSLAEFGLEDREIRHRLAPLFEAFQWDKDEPRSREAPTKENAHA